MRRASADSGFGLLPDGAWTATRYACPRRMASGKWKPTLQPSVALFSKNKLLSCYAEYGIIRIKLKNLWER